MGESPLNLNPNANLNDARAQHVRRRIGERLIKDLDANKFFLHYQSILPVAPSNADTGYREMLVRFKEEEQYMLPPGTFLPVLEEQGLMPLLDRWVVSRALKWMRHVDAHPGSRSAPRCGVNQHTDTICRDRNFGDYVLKELREAWVRAESLLFEIHVADAMADSQSLARLMIPLRSAGCRFALSDVTDDESAFELAESLDFAFIKIDGCMLSGLSGDPKVRERLDAINRRCHELGMRTVCMQVEATETLETLRGIEIDYVQGFGIERPRLLDFGENSLKKLS